MTRNINREELSRIVKYVFSAGSSFVIDLVCFTIFCLILKTNTIGVFISTVFARIISSSYNYFINSRIVFQNKNKKSIIMYFTLVVIQMIVSATLVNIIKNAVKVFVTLIKFIVDMILFIINYIIQKEIVFK